MVRLKVRLGVKVRVIDRVGSRIEKEYDRHT